jgi:vesicle-fusing ATPase
MCRHVYITTAPGQSFLFSLRFDKVNRGTIGFNLPQRKWATISLNQDLEVRPYYFDPKSTTEFLSTIVLEADFLQKKQ